MIGGIASLAAALACVMTAAAGAWAAQDRESTPEEDRAEVGSCIRVNDIRTSHIVDDSTILLEMRGKRLILMHLTGRCPQLRFHDFFSYEARLGQLCAELDEVVTRAGFHCPIANFSALDPADDPRKKENDP